MNKHLVKMSKTIEKYFKDEPNDECYLPPPPILCRQIATCIRYDETSNKFIDESLEINEQLRHQACVKKCLKEYFDKYQHYNSDKKTKYAVKMFSKIAENILPHEIILEIAKYL